MFCSNSLSLYCLTNSAICFVEVVTTIHFVFSSISYSSLAFLSVISISQLMSSFSVFFK